MSRARILTLFLALIALASAFTACGGGGSDSPQTVVDEATLQGIESGDAEISLDLGIKGEKSGDVEVSLSGPFQSESEAELPELDLQATVKGSVDGEDIIYHGYADISIAVSTSDFIENLKEGGSAEVGDTSTTKVSGDLNASAALDTISELIEDPACSEQLKAASPLPSPAELDAAKSTVKDSVKDAHVDLYVGDDHIVRKISARATIEPPAGSDNKGVKSVDVDLEMEFTGVNEEQAISAPKSSKPLSDLFLKLGINPIELLGLFEGQGSAGLGGLLEGLNSFGGSSGGSGGSGSSGGGQQDYLECLQGAHTATAIQNCVGMLQ